MTAPQDVFKTLPPELRSYALIGHYLSSFAIMESQLNSAIATALKLNALQAAIVCKNIQLRDKIKITRTLLSVSLLGGDEKKEFDKVLVRIGEVSNDRNMVAHDVFLSHKASGGVEFIVTKAAATLQFPDVFWSVDDTEARSDELLAIGEKLKALAGKFTYSDLIRALLDAPPEPGNTLKLPTPKTGGLMELGRLASLLAQEAPSSSPPETTDAISPEAPQELQEKAE